MHLLAPLSRATRRLLPLYIALFLQGFVLWYAVEKLFMLSIGFNGTTIGLMVALYSAVIVMVETPSGILADRWSRRGVAMIAGLVLALSGLTSTLSHSVPVFLISTCLWGIYYALYSGTYESIIYDTVLEETGDARSFKGYLGAMHFIEGTALIISSIIGGLIAQHFSLRATFACTIPLAVVSSLVLFAFREPKLHQVGEENPRNAHVRKTLAAVFKKPALRPILGVLVTTGMITYLLLEFDQLWYVALHAPLGVYGIINALLLGGLCTGAIIGGRMSLTRNRMILMLGIILSAGLDLIFARSLPAIVLGGVGMLLVVTIINIALTTKLHDSLTSDIRAGSSSAVSTLGRIIVFPVALMFGFIVQTSDIFHAGWLLLALIIATVLIIAARARRFIEMPD